MELPRSAAAVPGLRILASTGSTNADLLALAADPAVPAWTVVATDDQTAGRGRLDRTWITPPGVALAVSVLVRGVLTRPSAPWLPLLAGLAMTEALDGLAPGAGLKWPNDVLIDGRKVCGILVEVAPGGTDAVIGSGVNLLQTADQLPVATATSLAAAGVAVSRSTPDDLLVAYLGRLRALIEGTDGIPELRDRVAARCVTIGRRVRVELPGATELLGTAVGLDLGGRLEVRGDDGASRAVAVGDVTHVRAL